MLLLLLVLFVQLQYNLHLLVFPILHLLYLFREVLLLDSFLYIAHRKYKITGKLSKNIRGDGDDTSYGLDSFDSEIERCSRIVEEKEAGKTAALAEFDEHTANAIKVLKRSLMLQITLRINLPKALTAFHRSIRTLKMIVFPIRV